MCVFNLPEEDTFSEVMLLPCSLTSLTDAFPEPVFSPLHRAKANNDTKLETSGSSGNCTPVAVHSEKEKKSQCKLLMK